MADETEEKPSEKPSEKASEKPPETPEARELAERPEEPAGGLTIAQVLSHPVVKEMKARMETLQNTLDTLPEAIGRAVAAAQEAQRPKGIDVANPELLTGGAQKAGSEELVVQNLRAELDKTRKDVGYTPAPKKPKAEKKKK